MTTKTQLPVVMPELFSCERLSARLTVNLSAEGLREARSVARGCGVELVIAADLRELMELAGGALG